MKKVSSLLFVLMLALPAIACNFGATPPTATAPGAASNNTSAPTSAPSATNAPSATLPPPTTAPSATPTNNTAPDNTAAPNNTAASGDCAAGNGKSVTTASELKIEDLTICPGPAVQMGMTVTVHIIGTLKDGGAIFYSTIAQGQPLTFILGIVTDLAPKGLSDGIVGMTAGSKRRLTVPPILGYGTQGRQGVPANATLVYEVQLLSMK